MNNIKFTQVNSLPTQSEKGCVYFVSDGTLHLGKSDGTYLEVGKSLKTDMDDLKSNFTEHNHDDTYSKLNHQHTLADMSGLEVGIANVIANMDLSTIPQQHTHAKSEVIGLEDDLANRSLVGHVHSTSEITNLDNLLNEMVSTTDFTQFDTDLQTKLTSIDSAITALQRIGNYTTTIDSYAEIVNISSPNTNDLLIVLDDENKTEKNTIYIYNGTTWEYNGSLSYDIELRNFTTDKIKLDSEVTGKLPLVNIADITATNVKVTDGSNYYASENVEGALTEIGADIKTLKSVGMENEIIYVETVGHLQTAKKDVNKLYIVISDTYNNGNTSIYRYDGSSFHLLSNFSPASYQPLPYMQYSMTNVVASTTNPKVIELEVEYDENQVRKTVNVLSYSQGLSNQFKPTTVLNEQHSWSNQEYIQADGSLHLRRTHDIKTKQDTSFTEGSLYISSEIDNNDYLVINSITLEDVN